MTRLASRAMVRDPLFGPDRLVLRVAGDAGERIAPLIAAALAHLRHMAHHGHVGRGVAEFEVDGKILPRQSRAKIGSRAAAHRHLHFTRQVTLMTHRFGQLPRKAARVDDRAIALRRGLGVACCVASDVQRAGAVASLATNRQLQQFQTLVVAFHRFAASRVAKQASVLDGAVKRSVVCSVISGRHGPFLERDIPRHGRLDEEPGILDQIRAGESPRANQIREPVVAKRQLLSAGQRERLAVPEGAVFSISPVLTAGRGMLKHSVWRLLVRIDSAQRAAMPSLQVRRMLIRVTLDAVLRADVPGSAVRVFKGACRNGWNGNGLSCGNRVVRILHVCRRPELCRPPEQRGPDADYDERRGKDDPSQVPGRCGLHAGHAGPGSSIALHPHRLIWNSSSLEHLEATNPQAQA